MAKAKPSEAKSKSGVELPSEGASTKKAPGKRTSRKATSDNHQSVSRLNVSEGWSTAVGIVGKKIRWLVQNRIILNALNILDGRKGVGKSTALTSIAAHFSNGTDIYGKKLNAESYRVAWLTIEENYEIDVIPRFRANGGNEDNFVWPKESKLIRKMACPSNMESLTRFITENKIGLLILDPFTVLKDSTLSSNSTDQMREYLETIKSAVCDHGCTVIVIRHPKKGNNSSALDAGAGSMQINAVARSVVRVDEHPHDKARRVLWVVIKNSGKKPKAIIWDFVDTGESYAAVKWGEEEDLNEDEIMEGANEKADQHERKDANSILLELLKDGPVYVKELLEQAEDAGVGKRTMWKAKAHLEVKSEYRSEPGSGKRKSYWLPPEQVPPPECTVAELQSSEKNL